RMRIEGIVLLFLLLVSSSSAFVLGYLGPNLHTPAVDESNYYWHTGDFLWDIRGRLENPSNFGPNGIVKESISYQEFNSIGSLATLSPELIDAFIVQYVRNQDVETYWQHLHSYFIQGGSLILFEDNSAHNYM